MLSWPEKSQKYSLVHRAKKSNGLRVTPKPDGKFTWLLNKYKARVTPECIVSLVECIACIVSLVDCIVTLVDCIACIVESHLAAHYSLHKMPEQCIALLTGLVSIAGIR